MFACPAMGRPVVAIESEAIAHRRTGDGAGSRWVVNLVRVNWPTQGISAGYGGDVKNSLKSPVVSSALGTVTISVCAERIRVPS